MRRQLTVSLTAVAMLLSAAPEAWANSHDTAKPHATYTCHGKTATIVGDGRSETLTGTPGNDVIVGRGGNDHIDGLGGNDVICGGPGNDRLNGGPGNDHLYGGTDGLVSDEEGTFLIGDSLRGGPGNDWFTPGYDDRTADDFSRNEYLFDDAKGPMTIDLGKGIATGIGTDHFLGRNIAVLGSSFADTIRGSEGDDYLNGGPGSDTIYGLAGNDRLVGDSGRKVAHNNDLLVGGPGNDDMSATRGEDTFRGGSGDDVMDDIGKSADSMSGGTGKDLIIGELWNDGKPQVFNGGPGHDHLSVLSSQLNPTAADATGTWDMRTGVMTFTSMTR